MSVHRPPFRALFVPLLASLLCAAAANGQENVGAQKAKAGAGTLGGFDLNLTLWESSGLEFAPEAYSNQLSLIIEPRFNLGRRWFRGRWAEPLAVSARLLVGGELAGNDPGYRGSDFASPTLLRDAPEQVAIAQVQSTAATPYGQIDGAERRALLGDLWLSVTHGLLFTIPRLKIDVTGGTRVVLPTSRESRVAGLHAAPSLSLSARRAIWRLHFEYGFRAIKYLYATTTAPIGPYPGNSSVFVNGQPVEPYRPASSGVLNPDWGFVNFISLGIDLPKGFSMEAAYFLFNVLAHSPGACAVDGLPGADVCRDGAALGDLRRPAWRDSQWFLLEVDYAATSWLTLGLGLSTFQSTRLPNGELANPFLRVNRDNHSTVYLSIALNAESFATAARNRKK